MDNVKFPLKCAYFCLFVSSNRSGTNALKSVIGIWNINLVVNQFAPFVNFDNPNVNVLIISIETDFCLIESGGFL